MSNSLPFDLWIVVAAHLPVRDIVSLSHTCRDLYDMMEDRMIWTLALSDILDVVRLPRVERTLHQMPITMLKEKALRLTQVHGVFSRHAIDPVHMKLYSLGNEISQAVLAPGGDWVALMSEDGSISIYQDLDLTQLPAIILPPPHSRFGSFHKQFPSLLLESSGEHCIMVTCDDFTNLSGQEYTEFRIYLVEISIPAVRLLATITKFDCYGNFLFQEGCLVCRWREYGSYFVGIRKIACSPNEIDHEVILDMGYSSVNELTRIKIICPHQFVLSSNTHLYLYGIPPMAPAPDDERPETVLATVLAIYGADEQVEIWKMLCAHHAGGRVATAAQSLFDYVLIVWPPAGQSTDQFVRHPCLWYDLGLSRAIWLDQHDAGVAIKLLGCTHLTKPDNHAGYLRLGKTHAPHPSHTLTISLPGQTGRIADLSWDEESGRIAVLVSSSISLRTLVVIDLV